MSGHPIARTSNSGRTILLGLAGVVLLLAGSVVVLLRGQGADAIHDLATLPERFGTCGRTWHGPGIVRRIAEIRAAAPVEPVIVDTAPLAPCPAGVHPGGDMTATVVYVRVGKDAYVPYELVGGP